jgi:hypothetical protein
MDYYQHLREAFRALALNWQIVALKVAGAALNCLLGAVVLALTVLLALAATGLGVLQAEPLEALRRLSEAGPLAVAIAAGGVFFYLALSLLVWLYVLSGCLGLLARALRQKGRVFTLGAFFQGAGRLFGPFLRYLALVGLLLLGAAVALLLTAVLGALTAGLLKALSPALGAALMLGLALLIALAWMVMLMGVSALGAFGTGLLSLGLSTGAKETLKTTLGLLRQNPRVAGGYLLSVLAYLLLTVVLATGGYLLGELTPALVLPYELGVFVLQRFLTLVVIGGAFSALLKLSQEG